MEKINKSVKASELKLVERLIYLEQLITSDSKCNEEIKRIIGTQNKLYFYNTNNMFYNHIITKPINEEATASETWCLGKD